MAYTIGARHVLTGSGTVAISAPVGLRIAVAGIPAGISEDFSSPRTYSSLGDITLGNADGWRPPVTLTRAAQLEYPLPDSLTLLGYDLVAGATATVDELVAVAVPGALAMPWDRNLADFTRAFNGDILGPTGVTAAWSFAVPVGKKLWVASLLVHAERLYAANVNGGAVATIARNSAVVASITFFGNSTGQQNSAGLAGPMVLAAGESLSANYSNSDTGGYVHLSGVATGFLFDA